MRESIDVELFGGEAKACFYGRGYGSCHAKPVEEQAVKRIHLAGQQLGARGVVLPTIEHGINIVRIDRFKNGGQIQLLDAAVCKTLESADGLVTINSTVALAIANADCPVGVLYEPKSRWLCLLHLGIKCLLVSPNIIDRAVELARSQGIPANKLKFEFGFGIRSCCFGYEEGHENIDLVAQINHLGLNGQVAKGPRKGQRAILLESLIWHLVESKKLSSLNLIPAGSTCTACREDVPGFSNVWSQSIPHERGHRNLFIVKLAP